MSGLVRTGVRGGRCRDPDRLPSRRTHARDPHGPRRGGRRSADLRSGPGRCRTRPGRPRGDRRQRRQLLLPQQAERAGRGRQPGQTPMRGGRAPTTTSTWSECDAGDPETCPFTPGVGVSGVQFSIDGGATWTQPTYTGLVRPQRHLPAGPATSPGASPTVGPIGTLPGLLRERAGLQRRPGAGLRAGAGRRRRSPGPTGSGCTTPTSPRSSPGQEPFNGRRARSPCRAPTTSRARMAGDNDAWKAPVIVTKQNSALFSDKEQIWADNAVEQPVLRQRLRLQRRLPRQQRRRRAGAVRPLDRRRRHLDDPPAHAPRRTTARPAGGRAARSGPTAGASSTSCGRGLRQAA